MPCRYQEAGVCECPGGEDFEPDKGVIYLEDRVRCLDFDKEFSYKLAFTPRKLPGGRHVTNVMESMEKLDKARIAYQRSPKGKAARDKWRGSEGGRKSTEEYQNSPKFKLSKQKYHESAKGRDAVERDKERKKEWRRAVAWLAANPGKTLEDFDKECGSAN